MATQLLDVDAINLRRKMALLNDGSTVPISLIDDDGDDTDDPEMAVAFTAGPSDGGKWYAGSVADFIAPSSIN